MVLAEMAPQANQVACEAIDEGPFESIAIC